MQSWIMRRDSLTALWRCPACQTQPTNAQARRKTTILRLARPPALQAQNALGLMANANASGAQAIAIGTNTGGNSVSVGPGTQATADSAITVGSNSRATGLRAASFGAGANAGADNAVVPGSTAPTAIGGDPDYTFFEAVAVGNNTAVIGQGSMTLGISSAASGTGPRLSESAQSRAAKMPSRWARTPSLTQRTSRRPRAGRSRWTGDRSTGISAESGSDAAYMARAVFDIDVGLCRSSNIDCINGHGHALRQHFLHVYRNLICRSSALRAGGLTALHYFWGKFS